MHTWIEFINRLIGAFSGLPILLMTFIGFIQIRKSIWNALLSGSVLLLLGFEAWLGKLVVDGNLVPNQITIHMMGSVAIVLLLLVLRARNDQGCKALPRSILRTLVLLLSAVVVQIFCRTQTRELVDIAVDHGFLNRFDIIPSIEELMPRVHRSFAWFILAIASLLLSKTSKRIAYTRFQRFDFWYCFGMDSWCGSLLFWTTSINATSSFSIEYWYFIFD